MRKYFWIIMIAFAILFAASLAELASAALVDGKWNANNQKSITIWNSEATDFEYWVQAVSYYNGVTGRYSIKLYRVGNNNPVRTYFNNQPTINNGATGNITVYPSDYQNTPGDYTVVISAIDYFGTDTEVLNLKVNPYNQMTITCNADPINGTAPLTTTFTAYVNGGTGTYTNYGWDFNDGTSTSTSQNSIQHTYPYAGAYNTVVTVTDSLGYTVSKTCPTVTVQESITPLSVACSAAPASGEEPLDVHLIAAATGGTGSYQNYQWIFGDGTNSDTPNNNVWHTYYEGTFFPAVTVTDSGGNSASAGCPTITVNSYEPITGTCHANPTRGNAPLEVNFSATASGGSGTYTAYGWDFLGNNQTHTQGNTTLYIYKTTGIYTPKVTIYDNMGHQGTIDCPAITVMPPPAPILEVVSIDCIDTIMAGDEQACQVHVTDDNNRPINNALVKVKFLGNNAMLGQCYTNSSGACNAYQELYAAGTFTVYATAQKTGYVSDMDTWPRETFNVIDQLTVNCDADPTSGYIPLNVTFTGTAVGGSGDYTYQWDFDDPGIETIASESGKNNNKNNNENNDGNMFRIPSETIGHTYDEAGTYHPTLTVTDGLGHSASTNCPTITAYAPIMNYTLSCDADPTNGYEPLDVEFHGTINAGLPGANNANNENKENSASSDPWTYEWNFDDGTILINGANVSNIYYEGIYHPTVTATKGAMTLNTDCPTITVEQNPIIISGTCVADPTSGYVPLDVEFGFVSDNQNYPFAYTWIFDDGTTQTTMNATIMHEYIQANIYLPTLVVSYEGFSETFECPIIEVMPVIDPLTVSCDAWPTNGYVPLDVNFEATASGGSGTYYYYWTFDDGHSTYGSNTETHTYFDTGIFNPTIKVTDSQNNQVTENCPTITVEEEPITNITGTCDANPTNGTSPLDVDFEVNLITAVDSAYDYHWVFDDGTTANTNDPQTSHTYITGGYSPYVYITDNQGNSGTIHCPNITVEDEPIIITGICNANPTEGEAPLGVTFSFDSITQARQYTYKWNYGDGTTQTNNKSTSKHEYTETGIYNPEVTVTYKGTSKAFKCPEIIVIPSAPQPFTCDAEPTNGYEPLNVEFDTIHLGSIDEYVSFEWVFDDGTTQTTQNGNTEHNYNSGIYNPTVTGTNTAGQTYTAECPEITVEEKPIIIAGICNAEPTEGYEPLEVDFEFISAGQARKYTYKWIFDDGTTQTTNNGNTEHTYNEGEYYPTVIVSYEDVSETFECPYIDVDEEPVINNTLTCDAWPTNGYEPLEVEFQAEITLDRGNSQNVNNYENSGPDCYNSMTWTYTWIFDDGQTLTDGSNVWHTYNAGIYNPTVQATDGCMTLYADCPEIEVEEEPIEPLTVECDAFPTFGYVPLDVDFTAVASGGSGTYYYYWTFDDGHSTYGSNTQTHTYYNTGTFNPTIKVTDSQNNQITENCPTITVEEEPIIINHTLTCNANPTEGYEPLKVNFNATIISTGTNEEDTTNQWTYKWIYDDGTISYNGPNTQHTYNKGEYNPTVKATKGNTTLYAECPEITVNSYEPITGTCNAEPTQGYIPLTVKFEAKAQGGTGIYTYKWNFGENGFSSLGNTQTHTYNYEGIYNPTVLIEDNQGNSATISCPTITVEEEPVINITGVCHAEPTEGYEPLEVDFEFISAGQARKYTYKWIFDDGTTQTTNNNKATHKYKEGEYDPTLVVSYEGFSETFECPHIDVTEYIPTPIECTAQPTSGYKPLDVTFTVHEIAMKIPYGIYYIWNFGDDTYANDTGLNIVHTYIDSGIYNPTVTKYDHGKTYTTECPTINVEEPIIINHTLTCNANPTEGYEPLKVNFNATIISTGTNEEDTTNQWTYKWIFNDGTILHNGPNINHIYNEGIYNPKVRATKGNTTIKTECPTITVEEKPIIITGICNANPTEGEAPLGVAFSFDSITQARQYTYKWNYGDGTTQTNNKSTSKHEYTETGIYNPEVTVTYKGTSKAFKCPTITVEEQIEPITGTCYIDPIEGYAPLDVKIAVDAIGGSGIYTNYYYIFDDGTSLNTLQKKVMHKYNVPGTYNPKIIVTDDLGNTGTVTCNETVNVNEYIPALDCEADPTSGHMPLSVDFNAHSSNVDSNVDKPITAFEEYRWYFGDGAMITDGPIISHTYNSADQFNPYVVGVTKYGTEVKSECPTITVTEFIPELVCDASPTTGGVPLDVRFEAVTPYMYPLPPFMSYEWNFGDGNWYIGAENILWHTYDALGSFYPVLKGTTEHGVVVTAACPTITVDLGNYSLFAEANGPYTGYITQPVMFTAEGSYGEIVKYVWDFGDGTAAESGNIIINHTYAKIGIFNVKLTVYDKYGLSAVDYAKATIIEEYTPKPVEEDIDAGLWIGRIQIVGRDGVQEVIKPNDELRISLDLKNFYDYRINDARITIEIPELGIKQKSSSFDLGRGSIRTQSINIPVYDIPEGHYYLKIIVQDNTVRRIKYRDLFVSRTLGGFVCSYCGGY